MDFCAIFFLCVLGCFSDLGLAVFAGHVQKSMGKNRNEWERTEMNGKERKSIKKNRKVFPWRSLFVPNSQSHLQSSIAETEPLPNPKNGSMGIQT